MQREPPFCSASGLKADLQCVPAVRTAAFPGLSDATSERTLRRRLLVALRMADESPATEA